ncbi:MAG TPA: GTPase domain-containing protein [Polyangiaceae bacterium]|nr:GTPase domain-containing protein [Polyangiaceae bacterium]
MAVIDDTRGVLVVRIVYDGPALSGKTTSLQALARGVSRTITTPQETAGRTLFFDWIDYVGGLFDGRQIRCQIVSVPGQLELAERRRLLLETADAIVLVLDTREHEWQFSLDWVKRTIPTCRGKDPPVGLVLQANKRDAPDAVPSETMRQVLARIAPVAVVPSTATSGDGIREAFVLAVRLALDRVRVLASSGRLAVGKPDVDTPEELLARMQSAEQSTDGAPKRHAALLESLSDHEQFGVVEPLTSRSDSPPPPSDDASGEALFVPDPLMPGGMIWPPVDGRALLFEVASLDIRPTRTGRADWCGSGSGFRFHSSRGALFPDLQRARNELIEWARLHSANTQHLSPGRAVILADAGGGRLRLWQIVRSEATLRERLAAALPLTDAAQVASELLSVALQLVAARDYFSTTTLTLPCTLWTVGANATTRPTFVGLMPGRDSRLKPEPGGKQLLKRELSPQLRELRRSRVDYAEVVSRVASLAELSARDTPASWLAEIVHST